MQLQCVLGIRFQLFLGIIVLIGAEPNISIVIGSKVFIGIVYKVWVWY